MDFTNRFSDAYKEILLEIEENFTANINRQIQNDIERNRNAKGTPKQFQNVACVKNETSLLLENVLLTTPVIFQSANVEVNFLNECFTIDVTMNDLRVDTDYTSVTNEFYDMQITQYGKIEFFFKDIRLNGKVSLFNKEDSFMPTHFDVSYTFDEIETKTTSGAPIGQPCEHNCYNIKCAVDKVSATAIEDTMASYIWVEMQQFLNERLQRLLDSIIVEYSFSELFIDEPEEFQAFENERKQFANHKFDLYLESLKKEYIKDAELTVADPPLSVCFKSGADLCKLTTTTCHLNDLNTLKRVADASCYEDEMELTYYGHASMDSFSFIFDNFKVSTLTKDDIKGCVKLSPARHKLFVKFQILKESSKGSCVATVNVIALEDVNPVEQKLSEHDTHAFQYTMGNIMPFLLGYVRYNTNEIFQIYVNNFNYHYRDRN